MDPENAHPSESRPPTLGDLVKLCRSLNAEGALYVVIGGFAVNQQGFLRTTVDIDFLIEGSLENQQRVKRALEVLPDKAVRELGDEDLRNYVVVRVADEVVVDLMMAACGISYRDASAQTQVATIQGVPIPFASAELLLRMKQTYRDKDSEDRLFLEHKVAAQKRNAGLPPTS